MEVFCRSDSVFNAGILGGFSGDGETRREESRIYYFWSIILCRGEGSRYGLLGFVCVCVCVCVWRERAGKVVGQQQDE